MSFAYIGCRTTKERNAHGKGLKVFWIDDLSGEWTEIQLLDKLVNPCYLAFDQNGEYLYTVHGDNSEVSSFQIDAETKKLTYLGSCQSGGINPVFLSIDRTNRYCFVANLQDGNVSTLVRNPDGTLSDPIHGATIPGIENGTVSHPHQCLPDQHGNYLFVPAQGRKNGFGQINVFRIQKDGSCPHHKSIVGRLVHERNCLCRLPNDSRAWSPWQRDQSLPN